MDKFLAVRC